MRPKVFSGQAPVGDFNSRTSCEVRRSARQSAPRAHISTHAPLARCDTDCLLMVLTSSISTHAPLARCDILQHVQIITPCISTHAPLARCDRYPAFKTPGVRISTHAPLARCDLRRAADSAAVLLFQLTHLLRGATARARIGGYVTTLFQLTHLLRGATCWWKLLLPPSYFNSRTSCEVRRRISRTLHA